MNPLLMTSQTFQEERPVFLREQAGDMYSVTAYYASKIFVDLPIFIIIPLLVSLITYFGIGFTLSWV